MEEGAFGLIVNRPLVTNSRDIDVWSGGPVEPERSWILVGSQDAESDDVPVMPVANGLSLSASSDLLCRLLEPNPPKNARLILGYSGWGPRQLEAELNASAWLIADVDRGADLQHARGPDVGDRDSPPGCRSRGAADVAGNPLGAGD